MLDILSCITLKRTYPDGSNHTWLSTESAVELALRHAQTVRPDSLVPIMRVESAVSDKAQQDYVAASEILSITNWT